MVKFRKRTIIVDAIQWDGNIDEIWQAFGTAEVSKEDDRLFISTLEGEITASVGDWIIRGVAGELYPCKPDIFDKTYEPVESGE
jgi:hypothetical protein